MDYQQVVQKRENSDFTIYLYLWQLSTTDRSLAARIVLAWWVVECSLEEGKWEVCPEPRATNLIFRGDLGRPGR